MANKVELLLENEEEKRVSFKDFVIERPILVTKTIIDDINVHREKNMIMNSKEKKKTASNIRRSKYRGT